MERKPLPNGTRIKMQNGGIYIIDKYIASGGFSLVYSAHTDGTNRKYVIKEFYPLPGDDGLWIARRDGTEVKAESGYESKFIERLDQFQKEGMIGGTISGHIYQTIAFLEVCGGYALMACESEDMVSLKGLCESWERDRSGLFPYTGNIEDEDPYFTDLTRVGYALRVTDSLLAVLTTIHSQGYLHLDLNYDNVIWAGTDQRTGRNCASFVMDYGSSLRMNNGSCPADFCQSTFVGFSSHELRLGTGQLTPATDIYSAAKILFYLCCGENEAIEQNLTVLEEQDCIECKISDLCVPKFVCDSLCHIVQKGTSRIDNRYQSASAMQDEVRELINKLPAHPINRSNEKTFTLSSLKSMLEGSLDSRYNWAFELCDRQGKDRPKSDEGLFTALTWTKFADDKDFLRKLFPDEIYELLEKEWKENGKAVSLIMCGNCGDELREKLFSVCRRAVVRCLLIRCRTLLNNEKQFHIDIHMLLEILGQETGYLKRCRTQCDARDNGYIGLGLLAVYALLGPDGLHEIMPSPQDARNLFKAV